MRPPNSSSALPSPPARIIDDDGPVPTYSLEPSSATYTSSHPHDDTHVTYYDNDYWAPTYNNLSLADAEKDDDSGGEDDNPVDEEPEEDDYDMEDGGAIISDLNYYTEVDMDPVDQFNDQGFEPEAFEQSTEEGLMPPIPPIFLPHPIPLLASQFPPPVPTLAPTFINPNQLPIPLQQQLQDDEDMFNEELNSAHPMGLSNPNPMSLGPENPGLVDFLRHWIWQSHRSSSLRDIGWAPSKLRVLELARQTPRRVHYGDLEGDQCDFQGINWEQLGITRDSARRRRYDTYLNYVNKKGSDMRLDTFPDRLLPKGENYFRFRRMDVRKDVRLLHFQLRNIFGCASRTRAFYLSYNTVQELDLASGRNKVAMAFDNESDAQISTLTTAEDVLLVGGFYGDYRYRYLDSEDPEPTDGRLTDNISGITNHVQIHSSRHSSAPLAAFSSNDFGFRIVDLTTNKITAQTMFDCALNCSALSPDSRLRVMVGDSQDVLITDAETGEILQQLQGHRDFGFACDWAADGWTVATGNQDKTIRLWDARKWRNSNGVSTPTAVVRTEMSGSRSLRFSPLGSGKRVLVAAEEADFIHIIDTQTSMTEQTFDIFGEIGGLAFANEGRDLMALSCDRYRGGVLQLERCDAGAEDTFDYAFRRSHDRRDWWQTPGYDWRQSPRQIMELPESQQTLTQRRRNAAMLDNLDPF